MLKKKTGIKPKPKGAPIRRNVPGESQGRDEERPSQTPIPTPAPSVSEELASTVHTSHKTATDNATAPHNRTEATPAPSAALPPPAPVPTPPPTAPVDDATVSAAVETSGQQQKVTQANSDETVAESRIDVDHALTNAGPSVSEPAPAAPAQIDPVQPSAKASAPARSQLPAARPATTIRPPGTTSATASASISTSSLTTIQPITSQDTALAVPATPPESQTVTPTEAPEIGAPADLPQQSIETIGEPDESEPPAVPPKSKRALRKRKGDSSEANGGHLHAPKRTRKKTAGAENTAAAEDGNAEDGESRQTPMPVPVRPRRVRVPVVRDASEGQSTNEGSDAGSGSGTGMNEGQSRRRGGGGRRRSVTPEDADQQKVDMRQVKMGDLVKDLKIGKKFSRHDELLERERKKKMKAKLRAAGLDPDAVPDDSAPEAASVTGTPAPGASGTTSGGVKKASEAVTTAAAAVAPSFQIVDGQIVLNQASLQYDRHAAAADAAGEMEEEEEDEFTHHTTQNSYRRKIQKPNHWNDLDTEQFYDALRIFGTDFETIAKMFPGKNRRHLKLKFNREERANPARVNAALVGERMAEIDLVEFQRRAGLQLRPTDEILKEETARAEALAQEERAVEEEAAAEETRKREALLSKSAKEKEDEEDARVKGRGRGRKKKQEGGFGMFG